MHCASTNYFSIVKINCKIAMYGVTVKWVRIFYYLALIHGQYT